MTKIEKQMVVKVAWILLLAIAGLWLLFSVSWKAALGVFLLMWANNYNPRPRV